MKIIGSGKTTRRPERIYGSSRGNNIVFYIMPIIIQFMYRSYLVIYRVRAIDLHCTPGGCKYRFGLRKDVDSWKVNPLSFHFAFFVSFGSAMVF